MLAMVGSVVVAVITCGIAMVGSVVGIVIGLLMGLATECGIFRGAAIGAITDAVFCIEAIESCVNMWNSGESAKDSVSYVMDIISSLWNGRIVWEKVYPAVQNAVMSQMSMSISGAFRESTDPFETGGTRGISKNALDNIPKETITTVNYTDVAGNNSCSVCLQDFQVKQTVRILPSCQHTFHMACIDSWLIQHGSCPLCRRDI
ncbi:RING/U-box superfamily protein [Rhynchospora pubera]|uniref:RING/U-box superfamily protein n=1 Tax=Rhynchospora pubera TaxID=906938 RepID=A0AAV8EXG1_9POAL|nr:RING/U-box superfamily protein [Rhynchospora pubera]